MAEVPTWRRYLRFWGADPESDIEDELGFHLDMKRADLMARGQPEDGAAREAERAFGDRSRVQAELREIGRRRQQRQRRASVRDEARTDLLHAWRSFRRRPGIPLVVVLTLAVGIGAGTAVFSLFDAVVLNPLAVHRSDELVMLYEGETRLGFSYPMLQHVREHSTLNGGVAGSLTMNTALRSGERAEQLRAGMVTGNYFDVLGVTPQVGRLLQPADEAAPGTTPHVVLSDAVWQRLFGADAGVVDRTVWINEQPFTVVGVAPRRFRGTSLAAPVDVWLPLTMVQTVARSGLFTQVDVLTTWHFSMLEPFARIPAAVSQERVLAELVAVHGAGLEQVPEQEFQMGPAVQSTELQHTPLNVAAASRSREDLMRFLTLLAMVVGISLTIACVNVAHLMLMRSRERRSEMSLRAALGASRMRVLRQLLVESAVLAVLAGVLGVGVALLSMRLFAAFALPGGIALGELSFPLDLRVLGFTAGVSVLCAIAFGVAPAAAGSRADVMDTLRGGSDREGSHRLRGGGTLVAVQVGLSLVLLVTGSLFVRSLQQALNVDLGFRTSGVGTISVGLRQHGYDSAAADAFLLAVRDNASARPGISHVAAASLAPLEGSARQLPVSTTQPAPGQMSSGTPRSMLQVTPGYLELLGIRVLRGRDFLWTDGMDAPRVAILTESMARELWPGEDALGRQFVVMFGEPFTVIGIAADAHFTRLTAREPHILLSLMQTKNMGGMDQLRLLAAGSTPAAAISALRAAVQATDGRLPTFAERSIEQHVNNVLMPQRFGSVLLATFGVIALLIAAVGIYAVSAYNVTRRQRELGIRSALGARRRELVRAVLGRAWMAIAAGTVGGLAAAAYATRGVRSLLFGIAPHEPVSYAVATLLLVAVALLASWVPARRAASVDPTRVMRE